MDRRKLFFAALIFVFAATFSTAQSSAPTPPMGWNSWDAYGWTIGEAEFKANAAVLASIKQFGWQYAVIDQGWYMEDPLGTKLAERQYLLDGNGIEIPVASRFPDSAEGAGFKPLADWVHAQGLKFGLHIIRGIPRQAVERNLPIAGSAFHAAEAADIADACPWDDGNWGMKDNEAGQAYYDAMLKLYAGWGLDYLKVDCVSDHPYRPTEIRQIAEAIRKTGRPIVLSLSPGPTQLEHAAEVAKYAQMWRISDDHWDGWKFPHKAGDGEWPFGVGDEFDRIATLFHRLLKPGGLFVLGDVLPPRVPAISDALALLRFAAANGFLVAAVTGLVRTFFSDYWRLRSDLGLTRYGEAEMVARLARLGFSATRAPRNIGHIRARMTFLAHPAAA